jgi:hypothetical protein
MVEMKELSCRALTCALALLACQPAKPGAHRVELRKLSGSSVQLIPAPDQVPYCLAFTISASGVIRQLTMNPENRSIECRAGSPIGGVSYRFPLGEGRVKIYVLFSDRPLNAHSVADQIVDKSDQPAINATDLRLPGRVNVEVLEFSPGRTEEPTVGKVVGGRGEPAADAGR